MKSVWMKRTACVLTAVLMAGSMEVGVWAQEGEAASEETVETTETGAAEITDEQMKEVYDSIKKSVIEEYLEPQGILPEAYVWPEGGPMGDDNWMMFSISLMAEDIIKEQDPAQPSLYIAMLHGVVNWMEEQGDTEYKNLQNIYSKLEPCSETIPANIDFLVPLEATEDTGEAAADGEITGEQVKEIYNSIKESIIEEYMEPNGIEPKDFTWPESTDYEVWDLMNGISAEDMVNEEKIAGYPALNQAVSHGIMKWMEEQGDTEYTNIGKIHDSLRPYQRVLPAHIDFEE